jgi:exodeoxyribonuclease VII large subunit
VYAGKLRDFLRGRSHVQLFGELWQLRFSAARVYFELRDATGAVRCSMWRNEFEALGILDLNDGAQIVVGGGLDYYPGSRTAAPAFSFAVEDLRVAGEGDLLAQLDRLRKVLSGEGLFELQKRLPLPALPRTIGVVTSQTGKARDDILAGLHRRGWGGRVIWAFAPVQDKHAAPKITAAVQDLAATGEVDVIIVARGGGSLAELFCFCDETLCRTVAMLSVPVIASVGHHTDRTLIDDVAAVSASTPTHAAEAAVALHCGEARRDLERAARRVVAHAARLDRGRSDLAGSATRVSGHARRAVLERAAALRHLARGPADHAARQRALLKTAASAVAAASARSTASHETALRRQADVLARAATPAAARGRRRDRLETLRMTLAAHDPNRTLARGFVLVTDTTGAFVTSADAARDAHDLVLRFSDGTVNATTTNGQR